jgi:hypothetical protein
MLPHAIAKTFTLHSTMFDQVCLPRAMLDSLVLAASCQRRVAPCSFSSDVCLFAFIF